MVSRGFIKRFNSLVMEGLDSGELTGCRIDLRNGTITDITYKQKKRKNKEGENKL